MTKKKCTKCGDDKALDQFYSYKSGPRAGSLYGECKDCHFVRTEKWRKNNRNKSCQYTKAHRDKLKEKMSKEEWSEFHREVNLMQKFGLTLEDYDLMLEEQNGVCAICGEEETSIRLGKTKLLAVDHDHETGEVRGLLCARCNMAIGLLNEDIDILKSAIKYITKKLY
jgi:hypothetical protein